MIEESKNERMTQLAAILSITAQLTADRPAALTPAPRTPPTMECVVETGAPTTVARFTQMAADKRADIIAQIKMDLSAKASGATMLFEIVDTQFVVLGVMLLIDVSNKSFANRFVTS